MNDPQNTSPQANDPPAPVFRLNTDGLTWVALLGHWTSFAQAALRLPMDRESQRLKQTVPDLIALQSVWFALGSLDALPRSEQILGVNRAGLLIEKHTRALQDRWEGEHLPQEISELVLDAQAALDSATQRLVGENPADKPAVDPAFGI